MNNILSKLYFHLRGQIKEKSTLIEKRYRRRFVDQHQLTSTTDTNRYPAIFSTLKSLIEESAPNILSYGCSTGEECFSLRDYFPKGKIIGADINTKNLKAATKKNNDNNIEFIISEEEIIRDNSPFDLILAMSVLCRWEDTKDIDNCELIYPFEKFEKTIEFLYSLLNPGGLLVVYNANFKVEDSAVGKHLIPYLSNQIKDSGFVHKFDQLNNRSTEEHKTVIYQKA